MNSFTFLVPTKVIFGRDALDNLAQELARYTPNKVLVLYGSGSVVKTGVLQKVTDILDSANINYVTKGGVKANPILSFVYETIEFANGCDFILAVGGGSVLDTAKAVAHGLSNPEIDVWDFYTKKEIVKKSLPVASILTISAAGSETSPSSVITNEKTLQKFGLSTEFNRPAFAIMNPEFTYTLPKFQIACGVVDIMMHTLDRYFTNAHNNEVTSQISEGILRTVLMYGKTCVDEPTNYEAMSEIMWAGSLSHNELTGLGAERDFTTHQLGHSISGIYDSAHGATLSVCWGAFARYAYTYDVKRYARYAKNVFGLEGDDETIALEGILKTTEFFASLGMPLTLKELLGKDITDKELEELALSCSYNKTREVGTFCKLDNNAILEIYTSAK